MDLARKYPSSEPCSCGICLAYCARPGWWTVDEAWEAVNMGYGGRMMLEVAPERTFGVLSPAFKGCEGMISVKKYATNGCTFLTNHLCGLFGSGIQPLECRFCHHTRKDLGAACHSDIEQDWTRPAGRQLVRKWCKITGLWDLLDVYGLQSVRK